jgi:hypothetical protein
MRAHEMTFGVEIECYMPTGSINIGGYHRPAGSSWLPAGWGAGTDGSLTAPPAGKRGVEIVSPVLRGREGFEQVAKVVREIRRRGGEVNATCGLHVHVGFNKSNYGVLAHLISVFANHEKAVYAATGTKARERNGYCKGVKQYRSESAARRSAQRDRYHALNLATAYETVEVRAFAGTLNATKVLGYVGICLGMVEMAYTRHYTNLRHANWSQRTTCTPDNEGKKEMERLLRALGWIGRQPTATGFLHGRTDAGKMRSLKVVVKKMRELAKQYDAGR